MSGRPATSVLAPGSVVADRFQIEGLVTSGGFGAVYRGRDRASGNAVAVKILRFDDRASVERFRREADILATLVEPGVLQYIAHGATPDGASYLAAEWLEGVTLAERVLHEGLSVSETVMVARCAVDALDAVHRHGVIHRDIKPSNMILVGGRLDRLKLIDFGLARRSEGEPRLTETGTMLGTPGYMSPEVARGRPTDARADLFSLGCVLYECLTGRPAFSGENLVATRTKVLVTEPPPMAESCPEAPAALCALIAHLLAKETGQRVQSAADLRAALAGLPDLPAGRRRPASAGETSTVAVRRWSATAQAPPGAAVLVVLIAGGESGAAPAPELARAAERLVAETAGPDARVEILADGALAALLAVAGDAGRAVERAARCALALSALAPARPAVLMAGRQLAPDPDALIDAAASALALAARAPGERRGVCVDPDLLPQLEGRFELARDAVGPRLIGEPRRR